MQAAEPGQGAAVPFMAVSYLNCSRKQHGSSGPAGVKNASAAETKVQAGEAYPDTSRRKGAHRAEPQKHPESEGGHTKEASSVLGAQ